MKKYQVDVKLLRVFVFITIAMTLFVLWFLDFTLMGFVYSLLMFLFLGYYTYYMYRTDDLLSIKDKSIYIKHPFRKVKVVSLEGYTDFVSKKSNIGEFIIGIDSEGKNSKICDMIYDISSDELIADIHSHLNTYRDFD